MAAVQHQARLHETTVQKIAKGEIVSPLRRPGSRTYERQEISHLRVHHLVMDAAKALMDSGSYTRIEIIDDCTVMVR